MQVSKCSSDLWVSWWLAKLQHWDALHPGSMLSTRPGSSNSSIRGSMLTAFHLSNVDSNSNRSFSAPGDAVPHQDDDPTSPEGVYSFVHGLIVIGGGFIFMCILI